jgi:rubrerythrin
MSRYEDLENMIQALTLTIAIHEREEAFFRRSAAVSTSREAKALLLEIADDMKGHVSTLEDRKNKLVHELAEMKRGPDAGDR